MPLLIGSPFIFPCATAQAVRQCLVRASFCVAFVVSTGGMPSSHTAGVIALVTSIGFTQGIGTVYFAIAATFAAVVIHDAMGIRRAAGKQAEVINEWSRILSDIHREGQFTPENLKTMLGHSFSQVLGGTVLGLVVGLLVTNHRWTLASFLA
jgi:acid phosphatase family membrane protein YuiD